MIWKGSEAPSNVLKNLISEVEGSEGYARNDVRAKAKTWLISHVSTLDNEDILLARITSDTCFLQVGEFQAVKRADPKI